MRRSLPPLFLAALLALGPGCVSTVRIQVRSSKETNNGQVLYMLVRAKPADSLIAEDYAAAASQMFTPSKDESLREVRMIIPDPDTPVFLSVPRPENGGLVLYFFFTQPKGHWKLPVDPPMPVEITVDLGTHGVKEWGIRRN